MESACSGEEALWTGRLVRFSVSEQNSSMIHYRAVSVMASLFAYAISPVSIHYFLLVSLPAGRETKRTVERFPVNLLKF
jgi:hypothetical protein